MKFLSVMERMSGFLKVPGDSFSAKITPSGRQVINVSTEAIKASVTRYPSTGTQVITQVIKSK